MAQDLVSQTSLTAIANAIRTKKGVQTTYRPNQMASAINSIDADLEWTAIGYSSRPGVISDGYDYAAEIAENWDTLEGCSERFKDDRNLIFMPLVDTDVESDYSKMFYGCYSLISIPLLDTALGLNFSNMFYNCRSLITIPLLNTNGGTDFSSMFSGCHSLISIPQLDTMSGTNFNGMFQNCRTLTTVPRLQLSGATDISNMFIYCYLLENLGGFTNLGQAYSTSGSAMYLNYSKYVLNLSSSPKLTHDSLINVINYLYDIATKGCQAQKLQIGSTNLAKLTSAEIAIATNKGWTVS